jgi:hypothetical protein
LKAGRRAGSESGQAVTETMLLTWLLLVFFAATYQVFLVNQSLTRSMMAVHQELFSKAFSGNCYSKGNGVCRYNSDKTANITWSKTKFPEIKIRIVRLFERWGLQSDLVVRSNNRPPDPLKGCDVPCKHTKLSTGTYFPIQSCWTGGSGCLR